MKLTGTAEFINRRVELRILLISALILNSLLFGCASSLPTITEVRDLPGFRSYNFSKENTVYDPAVRAYRIRPMKKSSKVTDGAVLRDSLGKKIQTEEELTRTLEAVKKEGVGLGTKMAAYTLVVVYSPVIIARDIVSWVLSLPLLPFSLSDVKEYERLKKEHHQAVENMYASGRRHFDSGEFEAALTEWEHARIAMRSLRDYSDIDYWRGRALEAQHQMRNARMAYESFLGYSERSFPPYFKGPYPDDPTWAQKAEDAEKRIASISKRLALAIDREP